MTERVRRLEVNGLRVRRGQFVGDFTTWFESGAPTAIVGTLDAGKTTLVDLIMGDVVADSGTCVLDGVELDIADVVAWRGELTQGSAAAAESVCVPQRQRDRFVELAGALGMTASVLEAWVARTPPGCDLVLDLPALSPERSIAGLALALSSSVPVLVLDEPTMTVCSARRDRRLSTILGAMNDRIIIICSHDAEWLRITVSRAVLVEAGRVVAEAELGDIDFAKINAETLDSMRRRVGPDRSRYARSGDDA